MILKGFFSCGRVWNSSCGRVWQSLKMSLFPSKTRKIDLFYRFPNDQKWLNKMGEMVKIDIFRKKHLLQIMAKENFLLYSKISIIVYGIVQNLRIFLCHILTQTREFEEHFVFLHCIVSFGWILLNPVDIPLRNKSSDHFAWKNQSNSHFAFIRKVSGLPWNQVKWRKRTTKPPTKTQTID